MSKLSDIPNPVEPYRQRVNDRLPDWLQVGYGTIYVQTHAPERVLAPLADRLRTFWTYYHTAGVAVALTFMLTVVYFFVDAGVAVLLGTPEPAQPVNKPSNAVLIPGVNDLIPWSVAPIVIATALVSITVHELGHGIAFRCESIETERAGIVCLGLLPIGAFVEGDRDTLEQCGLLSRLRVYCAGVTNNFALFVLAAPMLVAGFTADPQTMADAYLQALRSGGQDLDGIAQLSALSNAVFWFWFLNLNLVFVNLIPALPFDGGHIVGAALDEITSAVGVDGARVRKVGLAALSIVMIVTVLLASFGPVILSAGVVA